MILISVSEYGKVYKKNAPSMHRFIQNVYFKI
jgi:hypothetical protein